jgi:hypothetical protein
LAFRRFKVQCSKFKVVQPLPQNDMRFNRLKPARATFSPVPSASEVLTKRYQTGTMSREWEQTPPPSRRPVSRFGNSRNFERPNFKRRLYHLCIRSMRLYVSRVYLNTQTRRASVDVPYPGHCQVSEIPEVSKCCRRGVCGPIGGESGN